MKTLLLFATELYALPILRPLAAAAKERGFRPVWFLHGVDAAKLHDDEERVADVRAARALAPLAVFSASNWVPHMVPGLKVQVFHGFSVGKRSDARGHYRIRGLFDLYCTQGPATTAPFLRLAAEHGHFHAIETGWPKLDPLFAGDGGEAAALRPADGRPVVMFASTFTERLTAAPHLYDAIAADVAKGERYWLLTLHPKIDPHWIARYRALEGANARWLDSDRLMPMQRAADALLCDTSSVVSEFVVQHKAVATFRNRQPQPHMLDFSDAADFDRMLAAALQPTADRLDLIRRYADEIHPYRDGRSSERVLDAALQVIERGQRLRRKPLNLWRKLQIRRDLGAYWF